MIHLDDCGAVCFDDTLQDTGQRGYVLFVSAIHMPSNFLIPVVFHIDQPLADLGGA